MRAASRDPEMFPALTREGLAAGGVCSSLEARDVVYRLAVADEKESDAAHLDVSRCRDARVLRGDEKRIGNFWGEN